MKRVEIINHKSEYDKLQQMDYDELYKLLKEYGNAIWMMIMVKKLYLIKILLLLQ